MLLKEACDVLDQEYMIIHNVLVGIRFVIGIGISINMENNLQ